MNELEKSNDVTAQIEEIIAQIVQCIRESHSENTWEAVGRSVLVDGDLSACHDIRVISLYEEMKRLETQEETEVMRMVRISQENNMKRMNQ